MEKQINQAENLLEVKDLVVEYTSGGKIVQAVNGISFTVNKGETLGFVGETGAGKTSVAKAILRILPDHATRKTEGEIIFEGRNLLGIKETEMQEVRGRHISMIFQDPMTALNPVETVSSQISDGLKRHHGLTKAEAKLEAIKMLETVGIPADRADEYPHQFSGGMKQRVIIAMALACNPDFLIADEPTTALDVTIQAQVLDLIRKLRDERGTAMLLITHDLGVIAETCDRVAVVYAGKIIEYGSLEDIFDHAAHPYTKGLFAALPDIRVKTPRLEAIDGMPPDPTNLPEGCAFCPRCKYAGAGCACGDIGLRELGNGHLVRCIKDVFKEN